MFCVRQGYGQGCCCISVKIREREREMSVNIDRQNERPHMTYTEVLFVLVSLKREINREQKQK